jgi:hypothetical protein
MNPFEMVVLIILIVTIGRVLQTRFGHAGHGRRRDNDAGEAAPGMDAAEAGRARDEIRQLKERVAVLERLITDNRSTIELDREIEKLRDRS